MRRMTYSVEFGVDGHTLEARITKDPRGKGILSYRVVTGTRGMSDDCRMAPMELRALASAIKEVAAASQGCLALLGLAMNEQGEESLGIFKPLRDDDKEEG